MKKIIFIAFVSIVCISTKAQMSPASIDSLVNATLTTFDVPGIAVGIIKDGNLIFAKGYGVRSLSSKLPVDENTLFGIASNSKAFTSAALAMLADEGKIKWDDKVTDYIPGFMMYDPYVTREFTIRDLLTHRSGLGLGAGDLMFWPEGGDISRDEMIHNLRYLKPVSSFRSKYDYDNNMYMVAGQIIEKVSGTTWEEFIEQRIMKPLGFTTSKASYNRVGAGANMIEPHAPADGKVVQIPHDWNPTVNAAGGILSNINDLSKWLIMQMNDGEYGSGKRLFSKKNHDEMWQMQTIIPVRNPGPYNTHFSGYALGWGVSDVKGYKQVTHTGGLAGTVTQITLLPELKLGIIVLTNQQQGAAFSTITNTIKDSYLGYGNRNWLAQYKTRYIAANKEADSIKNAVDADVAAQLKNNKTKLADSLITGTYKDQWFGNIEISKANDGLWFAATRSPKLNGKMFAYKANTYIVKWTDRSLDADAYVTFALDKDGRSTGFSIEAISPLTDFSFDFQDLDLKRIK